jgi:hypothetical protein
MGDDYPEERENPIIRGEREELGEAPLNAQWGTHEEQLLERAQKDRLADELIADDKASGKSPPFWKRLFHRT